MSDRIVVKDLEVFARHGVAAEEKRLGQRFAIDIVAHLDLRPAGESDDYAQTAGYDAMIALATETLTAKSYNLIEAAAEAVAQAVLARFPARPELLTFLAEHVIERLDRDGDLFADVLELEQSLPRV